MRASDDPIDLYSSSILFPPPPSNPNHSKRNGLRGRSCQFRYRICPRTSLPSRSRGSWNSDITIWWTRHDRAQRRWI
ncbi:hypothetical protein VTN00DRAFT_3549 [Thermoascus crustaceus]|uniref:uncharacterized protein n=1 Tax=Thermoascus crustaceus TaxID=5088 RepID=UPI00374414B8